jgi:opacity protein-like surface antigen
VATVIRRTSQASQVLIGGLCVAGSLATVQPVRAAEYGWGEYLLGLTLPMAGYVPPPGVYFSDSTYFYKGSADGNLAFPFGRNLAIGVHEQFAVNIATLSWITETKIFGGSLGFALTAPWGKADISVDTAFTGPLGVNRQLGVSQTATGTGDSAVTALLGWTEGNHHWSLSATGIIPSGVYDPDRVAFIGLSRPGADLKAAYTYLDPKVGTEFSGAAGMTFNAINAITDYQTGTELHVEAALIQHFKLQSKAVEEFQAGVGGYVYQQLTDDGGSGDRVGPFRGRTVALGPIVGYTFEVGETPITVNARWFHEFEVENRVKGDSGFLTMSLPLQVYVAEAAAAKKAEAAAAKKSANVYKAPATAQTETSWTGFYVGANAGGVWSNSDLTWTAHPADFPGHDAAIDAPGTGNIRSAGFTSGGQLGFNYQIKSILLGLEADYGYTALSGTRTALAIPAFGPAEPIAESFDSDFLATFRARLGVVNGSWLVYATGGAAAARVNFNDSIVFPALGSINAASANVIAAGWTAGGGVEWAFCSNWSVKAEYLHVDLGKESDRSFSSAPPFVIPRIIHDHSLTEDLARVGLNYRFGPSNVVAAKY